MANSYELSDLELGDILLVSGDSFDVTAQVITEGPFPGCVFNTRDNEKTVVQILGTADYRSREDSVTSNFEPRLNPGSGRLVFLDLHEAAQATSKSFINLEIRRAGEVIFKYVDAES